MDLHTRKRVWEEIQDVNADFFNLRTVIAPAHDDDFTQFYFIMSPNDGAMAHMKVFGCFYIPDTYPESPPVVHLYSKTGRRNADVYRSCIGDRTRSSLCFDILRSEKNGGIWKPDYTISMLCATLMATIVSFYVPQECGGEVAEYVSMEKLEDIKRAAHETFDTYKHLVPELPSIPLVQATTIAAQQMRFPATIVTEGTTTTTAGPIYLQTADRTVHTFAMDLSELHAGVVFSVILSSSGTDLVGKAPSTILVRNGVTATAARKRCNENTTWFYHGKPMNDGDMRLHVTIGRDQMTFAYYSSDGNRYVHGDCPVSRLTETSIGDVRGTPFYVHIFTKKKYGQAAKLTFLDTEGKGYIHTVGHEYGDMLDDYEYIIPEPAETAGGSDDNLEFELVNDSEIAEAVEQSILQAASVLREERRRRKEQKSADWPDLDENFLEGIMNLGIESDNVTQKE
ncbi:hypothetical protein GGR57DRAFT_480178 [Xylariaceae sp. FL1272]|nr:hypothetical protein GGR57DRAFT_480178 [Xylariaceae sp. FL1272]